MSRVRALTRQGQFAKAWELADRMPAAGNEVFARLKVVAAAGCSATTAIRHADVPALEARFDTRSAAGWSLLRERLTKGDEADRYVAWQVLDGHLADPGVRKNLLGDLALKRSLIARLTSLHNCPPSGTIRCPDPNMDFAADMTFASTLSTAALVAVYRDEQAYAAIATLSRCPTMFSWLLEAGAFSQMTIGCERALISRLIERQHVAGDVDAILDVLATQGHASAADLLDSGHFQNPDTAAKSRRASSALRSRDAGTLR